MRKQSADFLVDVLTKTSAEEDEFILAAIQEKYSNVRKDSASVRGAGQAIAGGAKKAGSAIMDLLQALKAKGAGAVDNVSQAAAPYVDDAKTGANMLTGGRFGNRIGGSVDSWPVKFERPLQMMTGAGAAAAAGLGAGAAAGYGAARATEEPTLLERLGIQ